LRLSIIFRHAERGAAAFSHQGCQWGIGLPGTGLEIGQGAFTVGKKLLALGICGIIVVTATAEQEQQDRQDHLSQRNRNTLRSSGFHWLLFQVADQFASWRVNSSSACISSGWRK
jgi:hypothetical protein